MFCYKHVQQMVTFRYHLSGDMYIIGGEMFIGELTGAWVMQRIGNEVVVVTRAMFLIWLNFFCSFWLSLVKTWLSRVNTDVI